MGAGNDHNSPAFTFVFKPKISTWSTFWRNHFIIENFDSGILIDNVLLCTFVFIHYRSPKPLLRCCINPTSRFCNAVSPTFSTILIAYDSPDRKPCKAPTAPVISATASEPVNAAARNPRPPQIVADTVDDTNFGAM